MRVTIIHAVQSAPYEYVQKKGNGCFQIKLLGVLEIKMGIIKKCDVIKIEKCIKYSRCWKGLK